MGNPSLKVYQNMYRNINSIDPLSRFIHWIDLLNRQWKKHFSNTDLPLPNFQMDMLRYYQYNTRTVLWLCKWLIHTTLKIFWYKIPAFGGRVTHIWVSKLSRWCFIQWLFASKTSSHYLNQYWHQTFDQNANIFFLENTFSHVVGKTGGFLVQAVLAAG